MSSRGDECTTVRFRLNGTPVECLAGADDVVLDLVREGHGLHAAKLGCGHGACGACTVHVDGVPMVSCLLPVTAVHGREVTTLEALSARGLHPVQRAFMARDGMQCGFCTPGFVTEAIAYCDRRRREHGDVAPDHAEIALALRGHLCRCGAQPGILAAVAEACAGLHDEPIENAPRQDARAKVTGAADFIADVPAESLLEGVIVRSGFPHARIVSMDLAPALALPGVRAAVEIAAPGDIVLFRGQELAAIAATSLAAARTAARAVVVRLEPLEPVLTAAQALAPGAPRVHHGVLRDAPLANEAPAMPALWHGNRRGPQSWFSRRRAAARAAVRDATRAGRCVNATWTTAVQLHAPLETHVAIARWLDRRLEVRASTQACEDLVRDLADRLDMPASDVRVTCPFIGGAFGGKADLTAETLAAALLARQAGQAVRVALTRQEECAVMGGRSAMTMRLKLAADADGRMSGLMADCVSDGGIAVGGAIGPVLKLAYDIPRVLADADVVTHAPQARAVRAPGGPVAGWALEQAVDELAALVGRDPVDLRIDACDEATRANSRRVLRRAAEQPLWSARGPVAASSGRFRRGVGIATGTWAYFVEPGVEVDVVLDASGPSVLTSTQDIGTGTRRVLACAVAEELGLRAEDVTVVVGDTRVSARGPTSSASRTTTSLAPAAAQAARSVRERVMSLAARTLPQGPLRLVRDGVAAGDTVHPWREILGDAVITARGRREKDPGGFGLFDRVPGLGVLIGRGLPFAAQITEIEVDAWLGRIRVLRAWACIAAGRIVTPVLATSQAHGGIIQGIGLALFEERLTDARTGRVTTDDLEEYRIPGIADIPEMEIEFDEEGFDQVPGRSVGLGELTALACTASIGNAFHHATGKRLRDLPMSPARVIAALRA